jgi:hypothetical protein
MLAIMQRAKQRKPTIRQLQGNPTSGISFWSINGKIIPPMEPPVQAMPVAFPRRVLK